MAPPACSSSLGWPTTVVPSTTWVQCSTSSRLLSMMVASWATTTLISAVETSSMVFWCMHSRALQGVFEQVTAAEVVLHHRHRLATCYMKFGGAKNRNLEPLQTHRAKYNSRHDMPRMDDMDQTHSSHPASNSHNNLPRAFPLAILGPLSLEHSCSTESPDHPPDHPLCLFPRQAPDLLARCCLSHRLYAQCLVLDLPHSQCYFSAYL